MLLFMYLCPICLQTWWHLSKTTGTQSKFMLRMNWTVDVRSRPFLLVPSFMALMIISGLRSSFPSSLLLNPSVALWPVQDWMKAYSHLLNGSLSAWWKIIDVDSSPCWCQSGVASGTKVLHCLKNPILSRSSVSIIFSLSNNKSYLRHN